jgi:DNA-binding MarR family transcriptional regulator
MSRATKRDRFLDLVLTFRDYTSAVDAVNQHVADQMRVNRTDHRVLEILSRRGPMSAGELAQAAHLTGGAVTAVLDRLERAGYARRVRDTADRRRVLVEETSKGRKTAMRYYGPFMDRSYAAMEHFSAAELDTVREFMREVASISATYAQELAGRASATEQAGAPASTPGP